MIFHSWSRLAPASRCYQPSTNRNEKYEHLPHERTPPSKPGRTGVAPVTPAIAKAKTSSSCSWATTPRSADERLRYLRWASSPCRRRVRLQGAPSRVMPRQPVGHGRIRRVLICGRARAHAAMRAGRATMPPRARLPRRVGTASRLRWQTRARCWFGSAAEPGSGRTTLRPEAPSPGDGGTRRSSVAQSDVARDTNRQLPSAPRVCSRSG